MSKEEEDGLRTRETLKLTNRQHIMTLSIWLFPFSAILNLETKLDIKQTSSNNYVELSEEVEGHHCVQVDNASRHGDS